MHLRFNFEKSLQAAGCLLELHGDRMEYVRLLKLLYIADREMLAEAGAPITGDRAVAMDHGPVLSHVYDLIKGTAVRAGEWADSIRTTHHGVALRHPIGRGKLNKAEIEKLQEVSERYQDDSEWDICGKTHEFPEWKKNFVPNTSTAIPWEEALEAQGRADRIKAVEQQDRLERYLDTVFGA
jgi:uncharacterized phage-associated protein